MPERYYCYFDRFPGPRMMHAFFHLFLTESVSFSTNFRVNYLSASKKGTLKLVLVCSLYMKIFLSLARFTIATYCTFRMITD